MDKQPVIQQGQSLLGWMDGAQESIPSKSEFAPSPTYISLDASTNQVIIINQLLVAMATQMRQQQPWPGPACASAAAALKSRRFLLLRPPHQYPSTAAAAAASTTTTTISRSSSRQRQRLLRPPRAATDSGVRLTVSDAELESRGFAVRRTAEGIDVAALNEVFARVGFPRRQEERLRRALEHSRVVWLSAAAGEEGRPVAFARAAGDGVFNAVVWDVVVEPSCQGLGLGRAVMERLVDDLRRDGVANIVLYAETRVVGFYRLLDFAMDPDGIRGMAYYRKSAFATAAASSPPA